VVHDTVSAYVARSPPLGYSAQDGRTCVLRINIPVATVTTLVSNPLTVGPIFYFEYQLGALLLSIESGPPQFELSIDWVAHTFGSIWQPMLLGSVLVGLVVALLGFVVLDALWRNSLANYKARKRSNRP